MAVAAAAAAERRRKRSREEEEMTAYRRDDLEQGWEFKILRSATGAFKNPSILSLVLNEEGQAGWELLEKFDNGRLRFKRLVSARSLDAGLAGGIDPYRSHFGISGALGASIALAIIAFMALVAGLLIWINP